MPPALYTTATVAIMSVMIVPNENTIKSWPMDGFGSCSHHGLVSAAGVLYSSKAGAALGGALVEKTGAGAMGSKGFTGLSGVEASPKGERAAGGDRGLRKGMRGRRDGELRR